MHLKVTSIRDNFKMWIRINHLMMCYDIRSKSNKANYRLWTLHFNVSIEIQIGNRKKNSLFKQIFKCYRCEKNFKNFSEKNINGC